MDRKIVSALVLATFAGAAYAVDVPEIEPNNIKATATLATLAAGDTVSGTTTGVSTTVAGIASADYFRIQTAAQPLGIYRNRLALGATAAFTGSIRSLTQTAGVPNAATDGTFQSSTGTTRINQWYGFGRQEEIYYRVTGSATTTVPYSAVFSSDPVTPIVVAGAILPGSITIGNAAGNTTDTSWILYDSNFNPIDNAEDNVGLAAVKSVTLAAGTYFVAFSNFRTASNQGTPAGDNFRTGALLDFPNAVANASATTFSTLNFQVTSPAGTVLVNAPKPGPFDVSFIQFTVETPTSPTPITAAASAAPTTVLNDGTGTSVLRVTVTPGTTPTTTPHTVVVSGAAIAGGSIVLLDDGIAPDAVADDNIFNATATIASGTPVGAAALTYLVTTAADARTANGNITLTVREARGACCVGGVATIEDASACATAGGTFLGDGSTVLLGGGRVFASSNTFPIAIPDFVTPTPGSASTSVTITDTTNITKLAVRIGLTHTFVGDLIGTLSNGSTSVILFTRAGGGNDLGATYRIIDGAATAFGSGAVTPLPAGDYLVAGTGAGTLTSFNGSSIAGTWTLTITDNAGIDIGTITSFALELNPTPCPAAPACLADIVGGDGNPPGGDGVDGNDFQAFLNAFGAGSALADLVGGDGNPPGGDGADGNDFQAFLNAFGAGC